MASYAIFIPGVQGSKPEHLINVGLGSLCRHGGDSWADVLRGGPDGRAGMYASWPTGVQERDMPIGIQQGIHWVPEVVDPDGDYAPRFWIGWDPERPVRPEDIAHKQQYPGSPVKLADGHEWLIPESSRLNMRLRRNGKGGIERIVPPEMKGYFDLSEKLGRAMCEALGIADLARQLLSAEKKELTESDVPPVDVALSDGYAFACESLSYNYRLCEAVVDALELLDESSIVGIVQVAVDLPVILEVMDDQKKTSDAVSIPVLSTSPSISAG